MFVNGGGLYELTESFKRYFPKRNIRVKNPFEKFGIDEIVQGGLAPYHKRADYMVGIFSEIADYINSGTTDMKQFIGVVVQSLVQNKKLNLEDFKYRNYEKIAIFHSEQELVKQLEAINKKVAETRSNTALGRLFCNTFDPYKVDEEQKNGLYDFVENGEISIWLYVFLTGKNLFTIDEEKIVDNQYYNFIQLVKSIARWSAQNNVRSNTVGTK